MSKIEWTHRPGTKSEVWNMIRGCSLESDGCTNCYAMHFAHRFSIKPGSPFEGLTRNTNSGVKWTGEIRLMDKMLTIPLGWKEPRTCFVNSMTDLFHKDVPDDFIDKVFAVMALCPQHTFIILTKRAERMYEYFKVQTRKYSVWQEAVKIGINPDFFWPLRNVWMLVSAEDQRTYNDRVEFLLQTPAVVRGVSIEPQIGPVDMFQKFESNEYNNFWILNGGESGPKARPAHPDWFRLIRDQCKYAGIPYFFKQFGNWYTSSMNMQTGLPMFRMYNSYLHFTQKDWVMKGQKCIDMNGKICDIGKDFQDAKYPVAIMTRVKDKSINFLDGVQHLEFPG